MTANPLVAPHGCCPRARLASDGFAFDKTALASLDEKLIVFAEDGIDAVYGRGPDAKGDNNDWSIQRVQSDVGCINPRSVATTPAGVVFESDRGIELLTRSLEVLWIGKSVEDTFAEYDTITSAVLVADAHEVRFTAQKYVDGPPQGIVLAYDYTNKIWFTRKRLPCFESTSPRRRMALARPWLIDEGAALDWLAILTKLTDEEETRR